MTVDVPKVTRYAIYTRQSVDRPATFSSCEALVGYGRGLQSDLVGRLRILLRAKGYDAPTTTGRVLWSYPPSPRRHHQSNKARRSEFGS